jgi:hypothetical protein
LYVIEQIIIIHYDYYNYCYYYWMWLMRLEQFFFSHFELNICASTTCEYIRTIIDFLCLAHSQNTSICQGKSKYSLKNFLHAKVTNSVDYLKTYSEIVCFFCWSEPTKSLNSKKFILDRAQFSNIRHQILLQKKWNFYALLKRFWYLVTYLFSTQHI